MPFIQRDLSVLLRNTETNIEPIMENINSNLQTINITSPAFRRQIEPFLGSNTEHFLHELSTFARSPYDMVGYDRVVNYLPHTLPTVIEFPSSSGSDDDAAVVSSERNGENRTNANAAIGAVDNNGGNATATATVAENGSRQANENSENVRNGSNRELVASFSVNYTSEGAEVTGISMTAGGSSRTQAAAAATAINLSAAATSDGQATAINLSIHDRGNVNPADVLVIESDDEAANAANQQPQQQQPQQEVEVHEVPDDYESPNRQLRHAEPTVTDNIDLAVTSSSDECEFVLARKPPHLRTPELVSLHSETDSDVVYVDETVLDVKPNTNTTTSTNENNEKKKRTRSASRKEKGDKDADYQAEDNSQEAKSVQEKIQIPVTRSRAKMNSDGRDVQCGYEGLFMGASTSKGLYYNSLESKSEKTKRKQMKRRLQRDKASCSSYSSSSDSDDEDNLPVKRRTRKRNNKEVAAATKKKYKKMKGRKLLKHNDDDDDDHEEEEEISPKKKLRLSSSTSTAPISKSNVTSENSSMSLSSDDFENLKQLKQHLVRTLKATTIEETKSSDEDDELKTTTDPPAELNTSTAEQNLNHSQNSDSQNNSSMEEEEGEEEEEKPEADKTISSNTSSSTSISSTSSTTMSSSTTSLSNISVGNDTQTQSAKEEEEEEDSAELNDWNYCQRFSMSSPFYLDDAVNNEQTTQQHNISNESSDGLSDFLL